MKTITKGEKISIACITGLILFLTIIFTPYTLSETQQAVVTRFGKVVRVSGAGLHFKIPFLEWTKTASINTDQMIVGYAEKLNKNKKKEDVTVENEAKMITGDFNIVMIDFFVEWKVTDIIKYLYTSEDPKAILKNVIQSCARSVIANQNVDDVLTTGKFVIQSQIKENVIAELEKYDLGIFVCNISIQDAEPPTEDVNNAFKSVETAKQGRETEINGAIGYKNEEVPKAQAEADKIVKAAEASKEARIKEASGSVEKFSKMYNEYSTNKEITKTRMYLESIEKVLPRAKILIDTGDGTTQKLLPLNDFVKSK